MPAARGLGRWPGRGRLLGAALLRFERWIQRWPHCGAESSWDTDRNAGRGHRGVRTLKPACPSQSCRQPTHNGGREHPSTTCPWRGFGPLGPRGSRGTPKGTSRTMGTPHRPSTGASRWPLPSGCWDVPRGSWGSPWPARQPQGPWLTPPHSVRPIPHTLMCVHRSRLSVPLRLPVQPQPGHTGHPMTAHGVLGSHGNSAEHLGQAAPPRGNQFPASACL